MDFRVFNTFSSEGEIKVYFAASSKGKTTDFGSVNRGSIPLAVTKINFKFYDFNRII